MVDNLTKEQRSYNMSRISSKFTSQEVIVHNILQKYNVNHLMHPKIKGNPDIIIKNRKIAIFLHGCFWHGCPKCYREPKSNIAYWRNKMKNNSERDKRTMGNLKKLKWKVLVIWSHELKKQSFDLMKKLKRFNK